MNCNCRGGPTCCLRQRYNSLYDCMMPILLDYPGNYTKLEFSAYQPKDSTSAVAKDFLGALKEKVDG